MRTGMGFNFTYPLYDLPSENISLKWKSYLPLDSSDLKTYYEPESLFPG